MRRGGSEETGEEDSRGERKGAEMRTGGQRGDRIQQIINRIYGQWILYGSKSTRQKARPEWHGSSSQKTHGL